MTVLVDLINFIAYIDTEIKGHCSKICRNPFKPLYV